MKMIELGRSSIDIEHDGESYRLFGELSDGFIAWRSWTERLISKNQTTPLTEKEKNQVMHMVEEHWCDDKLLICFIDDEYKLICATRVVILNIGKENIDFMYKGKIVRVYGNLRFKGFRLKANTIEWVASDSVHRLSNKERTVFIEEVMKFCHKSTYLNKKIRIEFVDNNGKKLRLQSIKD